MDGVRRSKHSNKGVRTGVAHRCGCILPGEALGQCDVCQSIAVGCGQASGSSVLGIHTLDLGDLTGLVVDTVRIQTITALLANLVVGGLHGNIPITPDVLHNSYSQCIQNAFNAVVGNKCGVGVDSCICEDVLIQCIHHIFHILTVFSNIYVVGDNGGQHISGQIIDAGNYHQCLGSDCADLIQRCRELDCKIEVAVHSSLSRCNQQIQHRNGDLQLQTGKHRLIQTLVKNVHNLGT